MSLPFIFWGKKNALKSRLPQLEAGKSKAFGWSFLASGELFSNGVTKINCPKKAKSPEPMSPRLLKMKASFLPMKS